MFRTLALSTTFIVAVAGAAEADDRLRISGSQIQEPVVSRLVERFSATTDHEAFYATVGAGLGFHGFCSLHDGTAADIVATSRLITRAEVELCQLNGVLDHLQILLGHEALVFASSVAGVPTQFLRQHLFEALAPYVEVDGHVVINPHKYWSEIDSDLPNMEIKVIGPSRGSPTFDDFVRVVMRTSCGLFPAIADLSATDPVLFDAVCSTIRDDGVFSAVGGPEDAIVQRLGRDPSAFGIVGRAAIDRNPGLVRGSPIDGASPDVVAISSGAYTLVRPLYLYVRWQSEGSARVHVVAFLRQLFEERMWGDDGLLAEAGIVPVPAVLREAIRQSVLQ